jgi:hypothetical protein
LLAQRQEELFFLVAFEKFPEGIVGLESMSVPSAGPTQGFETFCCLFEETMSKYIVPGRRRSVNDTYLPPAYRMSRLDNQLRALKRFEELWKSCASECSLTILCHSAFSCSTERGSILVQAMRRLHSTDTSNGQDQFAFLELQLNSATTGWLYDTKFKYIAFEIRDGFVVVERSDLLTIAIDVTNVPLRWFRFPRQIYKRLFAPDVDQYPNGLMLTLVSIVDDILPLPSATKLTF